MCEMRSPSSVSHEQRERAADVGVWVFGVVAERRLGVGSRRNEAAGGFPRRERGGDELLYRVAAPVPVRLWRHRPPCVLAEQRDDRFHISALEGVREPRDELLFLG